MMTDLEYRMSLILRSIDGVKFIREHRFAAPLRKWQFDFAEVDLKIAVECEGGTWINGRHTTGRGFERDCEKYNYATTLGWAVLRYTTSQIKNQALAINSQIEDLIATRV